MTDEHWGQLRALFERALELPRAERAAFLAEACADRPELRAEVEQLLARDGEPEELASPVTPRLVAGALRSQANDLPFGAQIGRYTLVRAIGSGGMGTVFEALQDSPRRVVAVKTLHWSASNEASARRLHLEAAVLGALNHPCIAQVFEAGVHDHGGRSIPFFAMELIEGARDLVTYANEAQLDERRGLEVFLDVVDAVGHGHSRGVVHRDLKPSNVLVDVHGRPKVIDFGIARAAGLESTLTAVHTRTGQLLGTLQYMSPEQLAGNSTQVGERSDIYSLGVVLHELLTGGLPYDLYDQPLPAIARIVAETEVRRPVQLASDLGSVLLVCLAKDPALRYASCAALAADLRRYLRDEPIEATGPSVTYRLAKFVRRQRIVLGAALAVVVASGYGTYRARSEAATAREALAVARREAAKSNGVSSFLRDMLTAAGPLSRGKNARVVEVLDEATRLLGTELAGEPEAEAVIRTVLAECYTELRFFDRAEEYLGPALDQLDREAAPDAPFAIDMQTAHGRLLFMRGDHARAEPILREAERLTLARFGAEDRRTLRVQFSLDELLSVLEQHEEALARYEAHLPIIERVFGPTAGDTLGYLGGRAIAWRQVGRLDEAYAEFERILVLAETHLPAGHFRVSLARFNLATTELYGKQDAASAKSRLVQLLEDLRRDYGDDHPMLAPATYTLGQAELMLGDELAALQLFERTLAVSRATAPGDNDETKQLEVLIAELRAGMED